MNSLIQLKKLTLFLCLILLLTPKGGFAQQADFESAERFTTQMMQKMVGSTEVDANWIEDSDRFWYSYENMEGKNWYYVDAARQLKSPLFDRQNMAAELTELLNRPINSKELPLKEFEYNTGEGLFEFHVDSIQFTYRIDTGSLIKGDSLQEKKDDDWKTYSPDSTWIAFAKNHNLYLMKADDPDSTEYQLTDDGERWYSFQDDASDTTSNKRLESNAQWFEDSQKLYIRRQDSRKVKELWVIHTLKQRPELQTYKYPMPGDEHIPQDEVWVFDADSKDGVKLKTDKPEWEDESLGGAYFNDGGFFTDQDSDFLYILRRNRQWDTIDVLKADTETGEVQVLLTEKSKPYFNTRFAQLAVLNDDTEYIWFSERTGWGQLYLLGENGQIKNRITDGYYTAGDIMKIDTTRRTVYFEAYGREQGVNPYYAQLYRSKFDGGDLRRLTPENAHHDISPSEKGNFFVDNYSTVSEPTVSVLRDAEGRIIQNLEKTDLSRMMEAGWKAPETFKVKAGDDATDLYGVMWKPFNFDSTKTYPIISYVYPGPQVEPFPIGFTISGSRGRPTALSQLGFVVIAMGQRGGSPLRSKFYHNYGYGDLRDYPLVDNKYGIEQLAARHSFIDASRVGIFGHSGGGFMSTAALLTYPDFYDVAVSSAGNHDNNMYNLWWSEVHNGVRKVTRKVETDSASTDSTVTEWKAKVESNADLAANLKGHLLLVHGTIDDNVHPGNTHRMADALIKAGKRFDMMMLPGQRHGFGEDTPYFERMMWYYFAEHLLGDYRTNVNFNIPDYED